MKLRLVAPAKVNWTLEVLGRRDDGYHEVRSLLQTLTLHDSIVLSPADYLEVRRSGGAAHPLAPMEEDLAQRAAEALRHEAGDPELAALIELEKVIPAAAGLGGGSSDAAAVLRGLNRLWGLDFDAERLRRIGAKLGSDVPFFLGTPAALVEGRGERVRPVPSRPDCTIVAATPALRRSSSTPSTSSSLSPKPTISPLLATSGAAVGSGRRTSISESIRLAPQEKSRNWMNG
jgi:4-diphosphocytidyl-2-C-methyl-D-erythritol kinase